MALGVNDRIALVQATGQKVRDGVGAVAHGIREEIDGVRHHGAPVVHGRERSRWTTDGVDLVASAAGAMAALAVSRLVRSTLDRRGR